MITAWISLYDKGCWHSESSKAAKVVVRANVQFSSEYPQILVEIIGAPKERMKAEEIIRNHPYVMESFIIGKKKDTTHMLIKCKLGPSYTLFNKCSVFVTATGYAKNGYETYKVVAPTKKNLDMAVEKLKKNGKVRVWGCEDEELTPKQGAILEAAVRDGFFEVPRRCTLAQLAKKLSLSESTLSEHIRKIVEKLVNRYTEDLRF